MAYPLPHPDGDLFRLMAPLPSEQADELTEAQALELLRRFTAERAGFANLRIERAEWVSEFRISQRLVDSYRNGRLLLAGDAAHIHSPLGGQGLNTGIGDAENLAFKLALVISGRAGERFLDTYQAERRPVAESVLAATTLGTTLGFATQPLARRLFGTLAPLLNLRPVQRRLLGAASQLEISYRGGPLADRPTPRGRRGGPQPGDRVPNIPTRDTAGRRASLYDQLDAGWALQTSGRAEEHLRSTVERLGSDTLRLLAPDTGTLREVCLVRPDGHLAWQGTDAEDLGRWLDAALHRQRP